MNDREHDVSNISQDRLDEAERYVEEEEGTSKIRMNLRFWGTIITVGAVAMSLFHLYSAYAVVMPLVLRGVHVGGVLALVFLVYPIASRLGKHSVWIDAALSALAIACIGHIFVDLDAFIGRSIYPTLADLFFGVALVFLILEAVRRSVGIVLCSVIFGSLAFAYFGPWLPEPWTHPGYDLVRLVGHLYMTTNGIFGSAVDISSSYIILFCIFGAVLTQSGAAKFFIEFAIALMGNKTSGSGKAVALASFLLGGPSGSSTATTVMMGSVAYPMLARAGYDKNTAGGLLAAGGIGAIMSPPVMGAAAFLIAEFLGISYFDVIIMALIPTALFYASLVVLVTIDTRKFGMPEGVVEGIPPIWEATKKHGFHFASLVVIIALMAFGFTPISAVLWATLIAAVLSFCNREDALYPRKLVEALKAGTTSILGVAATCAGAGIIIGVVTLTGLGLKFSSIIVHYADSSVFLTALYTAFVVWVIGLAVPVTASYIICAVITAPALISVGVPDYAAHMFIFYYAVLAEVSPPTAMAPFAAAAITGGGPFRTTLITWKYTIPVFIVPFMFVLEPAGTGLLMHGGFVQISIVSLAALFGIFALGVALQNWLIGPTSWIERTAFAVGGLILFYPALDTHLIGGVIVIAALFYHAVRHHAHSLNVQQTTTRR